MNISELTCLKLNSRYNPLNQSLPLCPISADGNSILVVGQAKKNFGAFLTPLSHISHPIGQQVLLAQPSKYIQNLAISHHPGPKPPSFIWTVAMTSQLVLYSCPCKHIMQWSCQIMLLLSQSLPVIFFPKSALLINCLFNLISQYCSPRSHYLRDTNLALPQMLQGLVYFRAFVLAVPSALPSHGILGGCSHTFVRC